MDGGESPDFSEDSDDDAGWRDTPFEEPAKPIGPLWNLQKIVVETCDIVDAGLRQTELQNHFLTLTGFFTSLVSNTLYEYKTHTGEINRFLINCDDLREIPHERIFSCPPKKGDYLLDLEDDLNKRTMLDVMHHPIPESVFKEVDKVITGLIFANGTQVKGLRALCSNINNTMNESSEQVDSHNLHADESLRSMRLEISSLSKVVEDYCEIATTLEQLNCSLTPGRVSLALPNFEWITSAKPLEKTSFTLNEANGNKPLEVDIERPMGPIWCTELIIPETKNVIVRHLDHLCGQKIFLARLAFQIAKINEIVSTLGLVVWKLSNFLVNHNDLQIISYQTLLTTLPTFEDYALAFEGDPSSKVRVDGLLHSVSRSVLKALADDVTELLFAGGKTVKHMRALCVSVDDTMDEMRRMVKPEHLHAEAFINIMNARCLYLTFIMHEFSETLNYLDLLNMTPEETSAIKVQSSYGRGR